MGIPVMKHTRDLSDVLDDFKQELIHFNRDLAS
jgi:hypothetical protein